MKHCCRFKADDIYFLADTELYPKRQLSVGFCPICGKPVAELYQVRFDGFISRDNYSGANANEIVRKFSGSILFSALECNRLKFKSKPFGWKYGVNKAVKINGKECLRQYAYDFYGNKELVKEIKN